MSSGGQSEPTVEIGAAKQRTVLAMLIVRRNTPVPVDDLIDELWSHDAPESAIANVRTYVSALRGHLGAERDRLSTLTGAYLLRVHDDELDVVAFERAVAQATAAAKAGDPATAAGHYAAANKLWRGHALQDVPLGSSLQAYAAALTESSVTAREGALDAQAAAGDPAGAIAGLRGLVADHPGRESAWHQLIRLLADSGDRAAALDAFQRARRRLADTLGLDPGPELRALHAEILNGQRAGRPRAREVPAQLPRDVPGFTGRTDELAQLDAIESSGAPITVLVGTAGVGKSALAVHWAHQARGRFPDGQLYVNLRGFGPGISAMSPADAIRGFLDALLYPQPPPHSVEPGRIPVSLDAQAALYRSLLADRKVLVLLDNARDAEQVRPLVPGSPGSLVLVTSRHQLTGLVATEGARPITLDLLPAADARELLARRLGAEFDDRLAAEPRAVEEILTRCARLPLALAIVSARAATEPALPLASIAEQLRDARHGLDVLDSGDLAADIRAVFSWSYQQLGPEAARTFRLLGTHPGPYATVPAISSLTGLESPPVAELTRAHLLTEVAPGCYGFHDLLRAYAAELCEREDSAADRQAVKQRMLDHYLHSAYRADALLGSTRPPIELPAAGPGVVREPLEDLESALAWFTETHPTLLGLVEQAGSEGFDNHAWRLGWTLTTYLVRRGHRHDLAASQRAALAATQRLGDRHGEAHSHRQLARAYTRLGRYAEADGHYRRAFELSGELGAPADQAQACLGLAGLFERQNLQAEALRESELAYELFRTAGDLTGRANSLNSAGWHCALLGDYHQALERCGRALDLLREVGDRHGQALTWDSLGYAHHHLGDHQQAIECFQQSVGLLRVIGDRDSAAGVLDHFGDAHAAAGDPAAANLLWAEALELLDELERTSEADAVRVKLAAS
ncbi:AfsR/SARP family transcriptional regulator [Flindersiella endophytica]